MWHNRFLTVNLFAPPPTSLLSRIMKEMQLPIMYFKPIIDVIGFTFCRWRWTWLGHYEANPQGEERGKTKKSLHVWSGSAQYWTSNFLPQTYLYTTQSMKVIEVFFFLNHAGWDLRMARNEIFVLIMQTPWPAMNCDWTITQW